MAGEPWADGIEGRRTNVRRPPVRRRSVPVPSRTSTLGRAARPADGHSAFESAPHRLPCRPYGMLPNRMTETLWYLMTLPLLLLVAACATSGPDPSLAGPSEGPTMSVVVVSGVFDASGDRLIALRPPERHVRPAGPLPASSAGRFEVNVTYSTGDPWSFGFDALVADDSGASQHGFFEVTVPEDRPIETITIEDTVSGQTVATMKGSDIVP